MYQVLKVRGEINYSPFTCGIATDINFSGVVIRCVYEILREEKREKKEKKNPWSG